MEIAVNIFLFFKRRYKIILIVGIVSVLLGLSRYFFSEPEYKTSMIAVSNLDSWKNEVFSPDKTTFETTEEIMSLIKELGARIEEGGQEALAEDLKLHPETAKKLKKIDVNFYQPVLPEEIPEDKVLKSYTFRVEATVSDIGIVDSLSQAIRTYISESDYFNDKLKRRKNNLLTYIEEIKKDKQELDNMKADFAKLKGDNATLDKFALMGEKSYSSETRSLLHLKLRAEILIDELKVFEVLSDFSKNERNHNSLRKNILIVGLIAGFFGGIFLGIIFDIMAIAKKKKKQQAE